MGKAELIKEIVELQRRVNMMLRQHRPEVWMELSVTVAQLKSLFFIANEGSTNFRRLAAALGVTPSNVTGIIDRLVEQGLVSRRENPEDRRVMLLEATEKGKMLLADLRESRTGYLSEALANLSPQELSVVARGLTLKAKALEASRKNEDVRKT